MPVRLASISLPPRADAATIARSVICDCDGLGQDRLEDLLLCASELVSNATKHGSPPILLDIEFEPDESTVYVGVADAGAGEPVLSTPPPDAVHGRGLLVVDAVSTSWGCERLERGKRVWASFRMTP